LHLLDMLLRGGDTTSGRLVRELQKRNCKGANLENLKRDVDLLRAAGWPIQLGQRRSEDGQLVEAVVFEGAAFAFHWEGSEAAERLNKGITTKSLLARAVVDDLQAMPNVKWAILGSGTTVHAVAEEIFQRGGASGLRGVSTASIFVLEEYIRQRPKSITIEMAPGTLHWDTACLLVPEGSKYHQGHEAEVVITGFSGLTEEGFHTNNPLEDVKEKQRQLDPEGSACKHVMIPLEWSKIGYHHTAVRFPQDLRDRIYHLYTDMPSSPEQHKVEIIEFWRQKLGDQFRVKYVTPSAI
jgi:DeoR/GlpR family transcriptional regulator of sugar metabolism